MTVPNLDPHGTYKVKITAENKLGAGEHSDPITIVTKGPPTSPLQFTLTRRAKNFLTVSWKGVEDNKKKEYEYVSLYFLLFFIIFIFLGKFVENPKNVENSR